MIAALPLLALQLVPADHAPGPAVEIASVQGQTRLGGLELLRLAHQAEQGTDRLFAERVYRALLTDQVRAIRNEARFRLAHLHARRGEWSAGAQLLRRILDEEPGSARVRLELAGILMRIGDEPAARRELRAAQAGRPPAPLARLIDLYAAALRDNRPYGAEFRLALAPDSNIGGATGKDRLETLLGDFSIDRASRARSGVGLMLDGSAFVRQSITGRLSLIGQASGRSARYQDEAFNRLSVAVRAGAQVAFESDRASLTFSHQRHRQGERTLLSETGIEADWLRPLSRRAYGRLSGSMTRLDSRLNDLEDGRLWQLGTEVNYALAPMTSIGVTLGGARRLARDAAFANRSAELGLNGRHDIAGIELEGFVGFGVLRADERLSLLPEARRDRSMTLGAGLWLRRLSWRGLSPSLRLTFARTRSNIAFHDTRRRSLEIGIQRSF